MKNHFLDKFLCGDTVVANPCEGAYNEDGTVTLERYKKLLQ